MKRYNVSELKESLLESSATRRNILTLLESSVPSEPYVIGMWKGQSITLPDGIELTTKTGMKMMGEGLPVKVYNKDGQYSAFTDKGAPIELTYIINESDDRVTSIIVFD